MIRRNGKKSSCEPCRKSKIKCDHELPICQRCQYRGMTASCIYHPAPMTRPDSLQHLRHHNSHRLPQLILYSTPRRNSLTKVIQLYQGVLDTQSSGRHGHNSPLSSPPIPGISHADIQKGSTLLKRLHHISTLAQLAERYIQLQSHMIPIAGSLAQTIIASLEGDSSIGKMSIRDQLAISISITKNTCRKLELEVDILPNNFYETFTGTALRWEALGLLFTWAALALLHLPLDDKLAAKFTEAQDTNKASCVSTLVYYSNLCISLCKEYAPPNDVFLWLLHESLTLTAQFYGDCSHQTWQRLGDLATEALDPTTVQCTPANHAVSFLLSQSRNKVIASGYWLDKSLASLHGQVPRIPCLPKDFETPHDIDDDELLSRGSSHSELLHSRSSGWNQSRHAYPATYIRARFTLGGFRDELLQLSVIASTVNKLPKLKHLSRRYRATWLEMPKKLHYRDTDQLQAMPYMNTFPQLLLFLDYLQGEYLIYKELSDLVESTKPQLIWHCKRTLNTVIGLFASPKMRAETSPLERIRVGVSYGLPCAKYLILTLKEYNGDNKLQDHSPSPLELIHNISALISYLEQECHADDQLILSYIDAYRNLECALNDVLDLKQIYTLGRGAGTSSSTISPRSEILGKKNNIGRELYDWTDDFVWTRLWSA